MDVYRIVLFNSMHGSHPLSIIQFKVRWSHKQITLDSHSGSLGHSFNKIFEPQATSERLPCKSNDIEPLKPKYILGELQSKTLLPNS